MSARPAILLKKENKILTMRYHYGGQDVYNLPGGNVDFGEGMEEALCREMQEELGLEVSVGELVISGEIHRDNRQTLHCIFWGEIVKGEPILNPAETSALEICWLDAIQLTSVNLYPNVGQVLAGVLDGEEGSWFLGKIEQPWY